jgi:rifampicin phosphotransferase
MPPDRKAQSNRAVRALPCADARAASAVGLSRRLPAMYGISLVRTFKTLDQIGEGDLPRVGGKAFNCARLKRAGIPVPDGVVVPAEVIDEDVGAVTGDPWFEAIPADSLFAVRSSGLGEDSAGDSFAGIFETRLNVARDRVVESVLACRRSSDSDQARAYRRARQLGDERAPISILVQRMVPAVMSGVAFTVNPIDGADEIVIDAGRGLGEALVSGQVAPDEYRVSKRDRSVLSTRLGASHGTPGTPLLSPSQIAALADLLTRIEELYAAPQDIEWCHDGREFWIVQCRPVTTGRNAGASRRTPDAAAKGLEGAAAGVEWTRANLAEVLPDQVSPQALELYVRVLNEGERRFFGRLMAPAEELGPIIKAFHGRLYFNLSQLHHVTDTVGAAFADTLRSLGHPEQIRPDDEIARWPPFRQFLRALPDLVRLVSYDIRAEAIFSNQERKVEAVIARLKAVDPHTLSDAEIWATFEWWISIIPDTIIAVFVMGNVQGREDVLRKACRRTGVSYDRLVYPQLAAGERSVSTQQAIDLVALADVAREETATMEYLLRADGGGGYADFRTALAGTAFVGELDRFLDRFGHRGHYESDWALPRLSEHPAPLLFAVRGQLEGPRQDPAALAARQEADAAAAWREFEVRLTPWQRWTLLPRVRSTVRRLKQQYVWREKVRSDLTRVLAVLRVWHLALADRFVDRGWIDAPADYFLLHLAEVGRAVRDPSYGQSLRGIAAGRAAQIAAERNLRMPLFMREADLEALIDRPLDLSPDGASQLTGLCVSPGSVEAEVVVMLDPSEFARMKRGAILVAPATDPSWTPLFTLASGVIVEVGGMLSHASTIAREYGLPALANVKNATRVLKNGSRVRLDASGGRVVKLET